MQPRKRSRGSEWKSDQVQRLARAAKLGRRRAKKWRHHHREPQLTKLVHGLVDALMWSLHPIWGPVVRMVAAQLFHADPRLPRLTSWQEPTRRHFSTQACPQTQDSSTQCAPVETTFLEMEIQTEQTMYEHRCCVCFEEASLNSNCGHGICKLCSELWYGEHSRCPKCNQKVHSICPHPGYTGDAMPDISRYNPGVPVDPLPTEPLDWSQQGVYNYNLPSPRSADLELAPWRQYLVEERRGVRCALCDHHFLSPSFFDEHFRVYHFIDYPMPEWYAVTRPGPRIYPGTRRCTLCELLIEDTHASLNRHWMGNHLILNQDY